MIVDESESKSKPKQNDRPPTPSDVWGLSARRLLPTLLIAAAVGVWVGVEYGPVAGVVGAAAAIGAVLLTAWILYRIGFVVIMRRVTGKWRWRW